MRQPEIVELVRLYYAVADPRLRRRFLELAKAVAGIP
jgi:hypothetical protein